MKTKKNSKQEPVDLAAYRASKAERKQGGGSFLVSCNGSFAMSADLGREAALGHKLARVLGSPDLSYADREHFRNLITSLAEAVEIDLSHPDIVEMFWTLMVWAMKETRPGRMAHVRRQEIETALRRFEMTPSARGHDYRPTA